MIDAAKELIQEYKNITLEQLEEFYEDIVNQVWDCTKWTTKFV